MDVRTSTYLRAEIGIAIFNCYLKGKPRIDAYIHALSSNKGELLLFNAMI
ncbi:hypothetical protein ANAPC2_00013 [Anaplasma phagocytophilum]|nr:hypothetical protein ANAPC2_00013 [Anaplasma phagocytophilum]